MQKRKVERKRRNRASRAITMFLVFGVICCLAGCGGNSKPPERKQDTSSDNEAGKKTAPEEKKVAKKDAMGELSYHYDPTGKKDPFLPLIKGKSTVAERFLGNEPLTPLQKYSLSELKLVAVIQAGEESRAMVEDSKGDGYILTRGTLIGDKYGEVVSINSNEIVIEEKELDDDSGEIIKKTVSLILHKPEEEEL